MKNLFEPKDPDLFGSHESVRWYLRETAAGVDEAEARRLAEEQALLEAIAAEEEAKANGATAEQAAEVAAQVIDAPVYVAPVVVPKEVPKMQGGPVYREVWDFKIVDANLIPRMYMLPNTVAIGGVVRSLKGQTAIPGVRAFSKRV